MASEWNEFNTAAQGKTYLCATIESKHCGKPRPKMHPCPQLSSQPGWPYLRQDICQLFPRDSQQRGWYMEEFFRFNHCPRLICKCQNVKVLWFTQVEATSDNHDLRACFPLSHIYFHFDIFHFLFARYHAWSSYLWKIMVTHGAFLNSGSLPTF